MLEIPALLLSAGDLLLEVRGTVQWARRGNLLLFIRRVHGQLGIFLILGQDWRSHRATIP